MFTSQEFKKIFSQKNNATDADTFLFNAFISASVIPVTLFVTIVLFRRLQQAKELVKQVRCYRKQMKTGERRQETKKRTKTKQTSPDINSRDPLHDRIEY